MHTGSFIAHIKTEDIYTGIAKGFKATIDTLNHKLAKPLRKGKNKKILLDYWKMNWEIMREFSALRSKSIQLFNI